MIAKFAKKGDEDEEGAISAFAESVLSRLTEADGQECTVCFDLMNVPVLVPDCMHLW